MKNLSIIIIFLSFVILKDAHSQTNPATGRLRNPDAATVFSSSEVYKKPNVQGSASGRIDGNKKEVDAAISGTTVTDSDAALSIPTNQQTVIQLDTKSKSPSEETKSIRSSDKTSTESMAMLSEKLGTLNTLLAMTDPIAAEGGYRAGQFGNEKAQLANEICAPDPTNAKAAGLNQAALTERTKQLIASNASATGNSPMSFAEACEEAIREAVEMTGGTGKSILASHPAHPKMLPILLTTESIDRDPSEIKLSDILMNRKLAELNGAQAEPGSPIEKAKVLLRKAHAHLLKYSGDITYKIDQADSSKIQVISNAPNSPAAKRFKELRDDNYNDLAYAAMVVCQYQNLGNYEDNYVPFMKTTALIPTGFGFAGVNIAIPNNIWTKLRSEDPQAAKDLEVALQNLSFEGFQMDLEIPTAINQLFIVTEKPVAAVATSDGQMLEVDCSKLDPDGAGSIENIEKKMALSKSINVLTQREQYLLGVSNYITRAMISSEAEFIYSVMYQAYAPFAAQDDAFKINAIESLRNILVTSFLEGNDRLQGQPFGFYKTESMQKMASLLKELDAVLTQQRGAQGTTLAGFVNSGGSSGNPFGR